MRRAALVALLALFGPTAGSAICGTICSWREHHRVAVACAEGCHDHHAHHDGSLLLHGGAIHCHDASADLAIVVDPTHAPAHAAIRERSVEPAAASLAAAFVGDSRFRPPDILLITTQLRI